MLIYILGTVWSLLLLDTCIWIFYSSAVDFHSIIYVNNYVQNTSYLSLLVL